MVTLSIIFGSERTEVLKPQTSTAAKNDPHPGGPRARLQLFALSCNLGNFPRPLTLPKPVKHWSLTTLRERLVNIGAKFTRHAKSVTFQLAEVAVTRSLFAAILDRMARLAIPPQLVT